MGMRTGLDPFCWPKSLSSTPLDPRGSPSPPSLLSQGPLWASNCSTKLRLQLPLHQPSLRHRSFTYQARSPSQSWGG